MRRILLSLFTVLSVIVLAISLIPHTITVKELSLPNFANNFDFLIEKQFLGKKLNFETYVVKNHDSLSDAMYNMDLSPSLAFRINELPDGKQFTRLRPGDILKFYFNKLGVVKQIIYPKSDTVTYTINIDENVLTLSKKIKTIQSHTVSVVGIIDNSFYIAGKKAGISDNTIMNLADIFSWEIDFIRQLRKADLFKIIYEKKYTGGKYIGDGNILAAEIVTNGKPHYAFALMDKKGNNLGYYNDKGKSLRKSFLRSPVDYIRISSRFQKRRYHPVLHRWRSHRGVDYATPRGTPIHVTGNGKVSIRKWSRTYGRVMLIEHGQKYSTLYAHMSKFGRYKKGQRVKQGDVIGYVGQSGLATGPHLHYEFRVNGKHVDPLKIKFKNNALIPKKYKEHFNKYSKFMLEQLNRISDKPVPWVSGFE